MNLSEPRLISPLLDGFVMGDPISNHDGVRSCPAMELETDKKYIVKIVSLPASQAKMAALILAGAFANREAALDYFKELADGVLEETELLQRLSKYDGFVSFENWQLVPMEDDESGYDIYLLSEYRPTLENVLRNNEMTHLQAVNLGLDLCAALSVARRYGYLYANLRPSNIYVCNEREFRIGDLGFLNMDSLPYASLPDKYRSDYTPPEISDAYAALNSTMDTYAVGLLLYQAYNDGKLPPVGMSLDAPLHADLALSEIILKACAINPEDRWQDPVQMGQALANYLQSNVVNDTPIVPPPEEDEEVEIVEEIVEESDEPSTEDILAEVDQALEAAPAIIPAAVEETAEEESDIEEPVEETPEATEEEITDEAVDSADEESAVDEPEETEEAEDAPDGDESCSDEVEAEAVQAETPVDETAEILAQADDLIAHQLPEPPVAPEFVEVTLPTAEEAAAEDVQEEASSDAEDAQPEEASENQDEESEEASEETPENQDAAPNEYTDAEEFTDEEPKKHRKGLVALITVLITVIVLATAAILFWQNYYLQTIHDITLSGTEDRLTVTLTTDIADEKLTVKRTDIHGNALTAPVKDGIAQFEGLKPGTTYKLEVQIEGFHKLIGKTTQTYITASQTTIDGFHAVTGKEDGSVILSFSSRGPDSLQWRVHYSAEGEETKTVVFNGHTTPITGLTVGKEYSFTLDPVTELYLGGTTTITHTASKIIYAENLEILGFTDNRLAVTWSAPEGANVSTWQIRCYNDAGYDQVISSGETTVFFDGLDLTSAYTIEVTAEGMTLGSRTYLSANSVTIKNIQADASDRNNLKVSWEYEGTDPGNEWLLLYTINGSTEAQVITCAETSAVISPIIPGAHYTLVIQPVGGATTFSNTLEFDAPEAAEFANFLVTAKNISFSMCITPDKENWNRNDVPAKNYTTSFKVGESASFVMKLDKDTPKTDENVITLYVIKDVDGNLVTYANESRTWDDMWYNRYGKLTIPFMPEVPGTYTVAIYFNGAAATNQTFEIVAP